MALPVYQAQNEHELGHIANYDEPAVVQMLQELKINLDTAQGNLILAPVNEETAQSFRNADASFGDALSRARIASVVQNLALGGGASQTGKNEFLKRAMSKIAISTAGPRGKAAAIGQLALFIDEVAEGKFTNIGLQGQHEIHLQQLTDLWAQRGVDPNILDNPNSLEAIELEAKGRARFAELSTNDALGGQARNIPLGSQRTELIKFANGSLCQDGNKKGDVTLCVA
jgi:hypothetical protein